MRQYQEYPLTYFTNSTREELDIIIETLETTLPKGEVVPLFIEHFDRDVLEDVYGIEVTDRLVWAVNHTLNHPDDTESLIRYILNK